ncbi:MAG: hypothetical protein ACREWG_11460 [Gammaproteobacteria bacterium]
MLDLVDREARHLAEVTHRFFGDAEASDREWLARQLATPEGIDRLESFGAKFSRLQDTLSDKLLPLFLRAAGELPGTAAENLNRAERLGSSPTPKNGWARRAYGTGWCTSTSMTSTHSRLPSMSPDDSQPFVSRRLMPSEATPRKGSAHPFGKPRRREIGRKNIDSAASRRKFGCG